MNQRSSTGMTLLDCAKSAVEHFLKIRGRDTSIRNDRFFLITTEDGPSAVKVLLFLSLSPSFLSFLLHLRGDVPIGRDDYYWRVPEYPSFSLYHNLLLSSCSFSAALEEIENSDQKYRRTTLSCAFSPSHPISPLYISITVLPSLPSPSSSLV